MRVPQFTAEASLGPTMGIYRGTCVVGSSGHGDVLPTQQMGPNPNCYPECFAACRATCNPPSSLACIGRCADTCRDACTVTCGPCQLDATFASTQRCCQLGGCWQQRCCIPTGGCEPGPCSTGRCQTCCYYSPLGPTLCALTPCSGGGGGGGGGGCCPPGRRCCGSCASGRCDDACIGPGQSCP